jgi:hypothetical protein
MKTMAIRAPEMVEETMSTTAPIHTALKDIRPTARLWLPLKKRWRQTDGPAAKILVACTANPLEVAPEGLVVDFVVVLDFGGFDEGAELARGAVCRCALEVGEAALDVGSEDIGDPL